MKTFFNILLAFSFVLLPFAESGATIKVHRLAGKVTVVTGKTETPLKVGQVLNPGSTVVIPDGAKLEIINDVTGKIYESTSNGRITISRMMLSADSHSADNTGNVHGQMRRFDSGGQNKNKRVYVETGMVKRSMREYDPEAGSMELDIPTLAGYLKNVIAGRLTSKPMPVELTHSRTEQIGMQFRLVNSMEFPIYFNVLKIHKESDGKQKITISEVGQPTGSYVILPQQALSRENFKAIPEDERHILVATHCLFDMDRLLELINTEETSAEGPDVELPIYIEEL